MAGGTMRVCPKCGGDAPEESVFCPLCGTRFGAYRIAPRQENEGQAESLRRDIKTTMDRAKTTDKRISTIWAYIPALILIPTLLSYLWSVMFYLLATDYGYWDSDAYYVIRTILPRILQVLFAILAGILLYKLLDRMNKHMDREESLRASVMAYLRALARPGGREPELINELLQMSAYDGQASTYEKRLNPKTWAWGIALLYLLPTAVNLLIYLPLETDIGGDWRSTLVFFALFALVTLAISVATLVALIYLALHITRTAYTHELRWRGFANSTVAALRRLGYYVETPTNLGDLKERSVALYALLTILTLGFFVIYWLYVIIEDPNKHFKSQRQFETKLWNVIEQPR